MLGKSLFDLLASVVLLLVLLGAGFAVAQPGLSPAQIADYRGKFTPEQYEGRHLLRVGLLVPCALFSVAATATLFRRWRGAPVTYFISAVATIVAVEFLRPYVHPGRGEDYYELAFPLMATLLFVLFFTPVKRWYLPSRHLLSSTAVPNHGSP
jgi:hypothetical protein